MKLTRSQASALAARERRQACFHELGHSAVVHRFGGVGMPEVWRNTPSRVRAGQKTWLGTFKMYGAPGEVETDDATKTAIGVVPAPKNWRVFVGLAGLVAEQIADGVSDSGDAWTVEDVATVLHILGEASPDIEREVAFMCAA